MNLIPKKWADFQHYKDRCPPWIKLHRDLLNDKDFMRLPLASKALAPLLWLLASESKDGIFDASSDELEFRLRLTKQEVETGLKSLIDKGFFLDASTMLAPCLPVAIPEREREAEAKKETEAPDGVTKQTWQDFQKLRKTQKAPLTQSAIDGIQREANKAGWPLEDALRECCARGWRGFKAEWVADKPAQNRYLPPQPNETVPAKQGVDPALAKIIADGLVTKPMPPELRAKLSQRN